MPIKLSDKRNDGMQSVGQLWQSLYVLCRHVYGDNTEGDEYPTEVRRMQITSLKAMIRELEIHHEGGK